MNNDIRLESVRHICDEQGETHVPKLMEALILLEFEKMAAAIAAAPQSQPPAATPPPLSPPAPLPVVMAVEAVVEAKPPPPVVDDAVVAPVKCDALGQVEGELVIKPVATVTATVAPPSIPAPAQEAKPKKKKLAVVGEGEKKKEKKKEKEKEEEKKHKKHHKHKSKHHSEEKMKEKKEEEEEKKEEKKPPLKKLKRTVTAGSEMDDVVIDKAEERKAAKQCGGVIDLENTDDESDVPDDEPDSSDEIVRPDDEPITEESESEDDDDGPTDPDLVTRRVELTDNLSRFLRKKLKLPSVVVESINDYVFDPAFAAELNAIVNPSSGSADSDDDPEAETEMVKMLLESGDESESGPTGVALTVTPPLRPASARSAAAVARAVITPDADGWISGPPSAKMRKSGPVAGSVPAPAPKPEGRPLSKAEYDAMIVAYGIQTRNRQTNRQVGNEWQEEYQTIVDAVDLTCVRINKDMDQKIETIYKLCNNAATKPTHEIGSDPTDGFLCCFIHDAQKAYNINAYAFTPKALVDLGDGTTATAAGPVSNLTGLRCLTSVEGEVLDLADAYIVGMYFHDAADKTNECKTYIVNRHLARFAELANKAKHIISQVLEKRYFINKLPTESQGVSLIRAVKEYTRMERPALDSTWKIWCDHYDKYSKLVAAAAATAAAPTPAPQVKS